MSWMRNFEIDSTKVNLVEGGKSTDYGAIKVDGDIEKLLQIVLEDPRGILFHLIEVYLRECQESFAISDLNGT